MEDVKEAKSLRWLALQFPLVENPEDDGDRLCNAIHIYATAGAEKLEAQAKAIEQLNAELAFFREKNKEGDAIYEQP